MPQSLADLRILVVDDNEHIRKLVKVILRSIGVTKVGEAENGRQAIDIMKEVVPDVILSDWEMEHMDGLQLARFIRKSPESPNAFLPVIIMTGQADRQRVLAARDAGVNEFVIKPLSAQVILSRLSNILDTPRPFVKSDNFFGPDRRRHLKPWDGVERRGNAADSARANLSQHQINSLISQRH
jgi:CheY-like chemotaxis protein